MSRKNGFSRLDTISPMVRLCPARALACRFGEYFNSSAAFRTLVRVALRTTPILLRTRDTVAVETPARRATSSRFINYILLQTGLKSVHFQNVPRRFQCLWQYVEECAHALGPENNSARVRI